MVNQKQNFVRGGIALLLLVLLSGIFAPLASAADPEPTGAFNVVVSPPSIGLEAKPGTIVTTDLRVQNQGLSTEHIKITLMKFNAQSEDGLPNLQDLGPSDDFAKWVTFSTPSFTADPNEWKTVRMTVNIPANAAFGYYYAVVFSREGAEKQIQTKKANLLGALASLVLLDVKAPGSVRQIKIGEFSTDRKVSEFLPTSFNVRLHNTGNVHVAARGNIVITRGGTNVGTLEVNLKKGFILPDSYRKFTAVWNDGSPAYQDVVSADGKTVLDKNGNHAQKLNWDKFSLSKLRFGKYNAKLVMVYDDGNGDVSTEAKLSFWVIPWRIIGGFVLVGLLLLAGLWATVLRPLRRRSTKNRHYAGRR